MKPFRISTLLRPTQPLTYTVPFRSTSRSLNTTPPLRQPKSASNTSPEQPVNFYKVYGRALFKSLTLAFLSYQIAYWTWLTLETEDIKDQKNREIKSLEREVRLLDESRKAHRPGE
ncbi:uncharacterized protein Z518_10410 [Rhinocladiella mackenziei CBS 650.93]|uniref:Rhinocladiella mackenziei CBS 650.93 unplaced genomic scaffold supercont1.9, whole genome shotgun sequence n=1 Tax=Rhinocladiella mackenziei CBS 650.93 TaxID=1442369 RepID=A0A0D2IAJ4_9EURO|nr:uncharacterized protein Z518_10410 [Rhinocladiella mackenziei CBS 650.93]KIX00271.1 hypothetical protein Z518_10410 [Rhinocladiella mackenziei CBS 650.93]